MDDGKLLSAQYKNTYLLKLVGDVRVPLCKTIDDCVEQICGYGFDKLAIDFSEAENADSTTLGLMAKLCIKARNQCQMQPMVFAPNPDMYRLLDSMGFPSICQVLAKSPDCLSTVELQECAHIDCPENEVRERVLEAHKTLMCLSKENEARFSDLVEQLEAH